MLYHKQNDHQVQCLFFPVSVCMSDEFLALIAMTFCGVVFDVAGNLFFQYIMPENFWPLIDIVNYIIFQEETEKRAWTLLFFVPNLIFNPLLLDHLMTTPDK